MAAMTNNQFDVMAQYHTYEGHTCEQYMVFVFDHNRVSQPEPDVLEFGPAEIPVLLR